LRFCSIASPGMRWDEFAAAAPELAELGEERLRGREPLPRGGRSARTGWPRISPVEPEFVDGELMLGMMWRSAEGARPAARPAASSSTASSHVREGDEGDFKLYGPTRWRSSKASGADRYRQTIKARIDWEPEEPDYHVFAVDIESAGFVEFAPGALRLGVGPPKRGVRHWEQRES